MYLYNFPVYRSKEFYHSVIDKVTDVLKKQEGIVSIYQIGGINDLGISDLDIVAVFEKGVENNIDPIYYLDTEETYLFTHSVFAISRDKFLENQKYSLFHNYRLLHGENLDVVPKKELKEVRKLKTQIALEFLLMNLISRTVEKRYRILSVRNILLSAKAIEYDLDFLSVSKENELFKEIEKVKEMRERWFDKEVQGEQLVIWFQGFYSSLVLFLENYFKDHVLQFPSVDTYNIGRNINVSDGSSFSIRINGISLPPWIISKHKRIRNFNRVFNSFKFEVPMLPFEDEFLIERFKFYRNLVIECKTRLPNYTALSNPFLYLINKNED